MSDANDPQLLNEISRGIKARQLMENPLLQEAFQTIRQSLHDKFEGSKDGDNQARERIWMMLKVVGEVERHIESVADTGKMAEQQRESLLKRMLKR